jgi:glutathione S-transferase
MSFAPHVILNELGDPFDLVHISIKDGGTQSVDFKYLNSKGKLPILHTGSEVLTESTAILLYLALSRPERNLLPDSPLGQARAVEWMNWLGAMLAGTIGLNFHPSRFTTDPQSHDGIREKGRESTLAAFQQVDDRLKGKAWALDEHYSVVDPMLLIFFKWGNTLKLNMRQFEHWHLQAERMLQRPAVQTALQTENISVWE